MRSAADVENPFAKHAFIDQGRPPQRLGQAIVMRCKRIEILARNEGDAAGVQGNDPMVHVSENRDMQVTKIARYEEGDDLSRAVRQRLVASRPTLDDDVNVLRPFALRQDVFLGGYGSHVLAKRHELLDVAFAKVGNGCKFGNDRTVGHDTPRTRSLDMLLNWIRPQRNVWPNRSLAWHRCP